MVIEVCLVLIAVTHLLVAVSLFVLFFKAKSSIDQLQADGKKASAEMMQLLTTLNEVVGSDFRSVSSEAASLISKTSELVSDLNEKSKSISHLLEPLHSSNQENGSSLETQRNTFPRIVKWISRGFVFIKLAKELTKNGK